MTFTHPGWLWLLVPALVVAALELVRRRPIGRGRRLAIVATRLGALAALIAAVAQPRCAVREPDTTVVFLIDRSASIGDDGLAAAWTEASALRGRLGIAQHPQQDRARHRSAQVVEPEQVGRDHRRGQRQQRQRPRLAQAHRPPPRAACTTWRRRRSSPTSSRAGTVVNAGA